MPGEMSKWHRARPLFIPSTEWRLVLDYCDKYGADPAIVAAIGWHETHWGQLGAGKEGYTLGVGVLGKGKKLKQFKGLGAQLAWAVPRLANAMAGGVTLQKLTDFAKRVWKPGNPENWALSVWRIYTDITTDRQRGTSSKIIIHTLHATSTLKRGSRGPLVKLLQGMLAVLIDQEIQVDGIFGPQTEKAVKEFQKRVKIAADGIVGKLTWGFLLMRTTDVIFPV
jgi:peptidoglycan hydrolase-like protein with peptidoglycan-binding domain